MTIDAPPRPSNAPGNDALARSPNTAHASHGATMGPPDLTDDLLHGPVHLRLRRPRWRTVVVLVTSACVLVGGLWIFRTVHRSPVDATPAYLLARPFKVAPTAFPPLHVPVPALGESAAAAGGCTTTIRPSTLIIPSVCIDGAIVSTTRETTGALLIPGDVHDVGMWDDGAPLLSPAGGAYPQGTTLLAGHVNYVGQGDGALFNLYRVQPGAVVYATDAWGRTTLWRIVSARSVLKQDLPASVFAGNQGARRLVIVTCGGDIRYVPGSGWTYDDNVVVTAVPAPNR